MKSGKCPKCGSEDVTPLTRTRLVGVKMITCRQCTYVEMYSGPDDVKQSLQRAGVVYLVCAVITAALIGIPWILSSLKD